MSLSASISDEYDDFVPFYDFFYSSRETEIDFYSSLLRTHDDVVLELGCGTGAIVGGVARELSSRAARLTRAIGLDRSATMLRVARTRYPAVRWIQGDMTRPPFRGPFDLVLCPFNTLQMLSSAEDVLRMFTAVRRLLGSDGRFAIDLYNPNVESTPQPVTTTRTRRMAGRFTDAEGRFFEVQEEATHDPAGRWVELDWRVMDVARTSPAQRARLVLRLHHYGPDTIRGLLAEARLRILARYGDVFKSPFDEHQSKKQVLVCSR